MSAVEWSMRPVAAAIMSSSTPTAKMEEAAWTFLAMK